MSLHDSARLAKGEVDITELLFLEQRGEVIDQRALGELGEAEAVEVSTAVGEGVDGATKDVEAVAPHCCGVEHPATGGLAPVCRLDDAPHPGVHVETVDLVVQDPISCSPKHVQGAAVGHHGVAIPPLGRVGGAPEEVLCADADPHPLQKLELVEIVGDLGPTLAGEDVHALVHHGHREVAAGRRAVACLVNLLPLRLPQEEVDGPHIIQPGVPIIASKDPELVVKDGCPMCRAGRGQDTGDLVLPVNPLAGGELVLKQVILVAQVRVGVDVSRVASKDEHAVLEDNSRVVVARCRWSA